MVYGRCEILKDWNSWDNEIHTDEAQIARQGRAMNYDFEFEINEVAKTAIFSSTSLFILHLCVNAIVMIFKNGAYLANIFIGLLLNWVILK